VTQFNEELLLKKLRGEASAEEESQIVSWLNESEMNMQTYTRLRMVWQAGKINQYAGKELSKSISSFNRSVDRLQGKSNKIRLYRFIRYAAIFTGIIALTALGLWLLPPAEKPLMVEHIVPLNGQVMNIKLPDGSRIALNEDSRISYPSVFKDGMREVELEGEAFFMVEKMADSRFVVKTDKLNIEVTGTSFNVNTSGNQLQTVLVTGKVILTDTDGKEVLEMNPSEMATYNSETRSLKVSTVNTRLYTSWQEGLVMFDKAGIKEILDKMSDVYNVQFEYDNAKIAGDTNRYNFVFRKTQPFDTVFRMLSFIAPVDSLKIKKLTGKNDANNHIK